MKTLKLKILMLLLVLLTGAANAAATPAGDEIPTIKKERNHIRSGNKLYKAKRYAEAEVEYRKALQVAPQSSIAQFNLATALMRQGSATASQESKDNPMNEAQSLLENIVKSSSSRDLRGKASYDLGNIAYAQQQWQQAIEHYKNALRCNPADDHARDNLRLAQLKKQQQDKQNKQNKNQDQNKDKNQDKDKQDQNKDKKNQDQNKQDQDKEKQNKDKQNQQPQNQQNGQPKQQNGMSQQNVEQVLNAMQDQERATQQRINARQAQQQRGERARTNRKW